MKYCEFCGAKIENNSQCNCEEAIAARESANNQKEYNPEKNADYGAIFKKHKILIISAIVGFILLIIFSAIFSASSKKDPFDYTEVTFSGYDTNGKISINFNQDKLIEDIIGAEPTSMDDLEIWFEQYEELSDGISYKHNVEEGLSNGDTVTVEFLVMPNCSNKVKAGTKKFTVEGLSEVETVDIFADVELVFEGVSGSAHSIVKRKANTALLNDCMFNCEPDLKISNGDTVIVTITNAEDIAEKHNVIPKETKKEYKIENLASYITDASQVPMNTIKEFADKFLQEKKTEMDEGEYKNLKYCASYLMVNKDPSDTYYDNNVLMIYITYDQYISGKFTKTIYTPLKFRKVAVSPNNTLNITYEDGSNATFTTDLKDSLSDWEAQYNVIKLD